MIAEMKTILKRIVYFFEKAKKDHVSAYAAQSAFFLMLSMIPIILLLLTLVQYTPITKADVMQAAYELFPTSVRATIVSIIHEVYETKSSTIPFTTFVVIWSAGRGTLAMTNGLNCVYDEEETRTYIYLRVRAGIYTVLLLVAVLLCLVFLGFGNGFTVLHAAVSVGLLITFAVMVYKFLPNHQCRWTEQIPGAAFTAFGWILASYIFSVYIDVFKGFSDMYGSLTTIIIIMLWLLFCMYILLLGGEVNVLWKRRIDKK